MIYAGLTFADTLRQNENNKTASLLTEQDWQLLCEEVEHACSSDIITKDGAILYFEQTRAALMIDIDSAASKLAPGPLSLAILPDLFAAIRLRRLAGKILVDMPTLTKSQRADILRQADVLARCDLRSQTVLALPVLECWSCPCAMAVQFLTRMTGLRQS